MKVNGAPYRSIWLNENGWAVDIIDQTRLPHEFIIKSLENMEDAAEAISVMRVRGAPLIGATAAYGVALALRENAGDGQLERAYEVLLATRPITVYSESRPLLKKNDRLPAKSSICMPRER